MLLSCDYLAGIINAAITWALAIPRKEAIKQVVRKKVSDRPVFVVMFDPHMPSMSNIIRKHWRTMVSLDSNLAETFPKPPLVAYKGRQILETNSSEQNCQNLF